MQLPQLPASVDRAKMIDAVRTLGIPTDGLKSVEMDGESIELTYISHEVSGSRFPIVTLAVAVVDG
ncbi:hypothetical protein [Tsukamurella sp. NPDC003166]|uniref:hypothetical protein n=1 Tax=Tsukamurella sp. NPDC003166 TaxID=3154444 RepID=UPI0033A2BB54